jgi:NTP pyrophosphatase (non-canonical NTP hydrolase)
LRDINNVFIKTMEECGELVQACAKVIKYGTPEARHNLAEECGDVLAFIHLLQRSGCVETEIVENKSRNTILKYEPILEYSRVPELKISAGSSNSSG